MTEQKMTLPTEVKKLQPASIAEHEAPSYENHPFFLKKAEQAKKFLERVGLPKKLAEKPTI